MDYMPVAELMRDYTTGDGLNWDVERESLEDIHGPYLERLTADVRANGVRVPVRLCHEDMRVIDGHHRVLSAHAAGLELIPVADAWEQVTGDRELWWIEQGLGTLSPEQLATIREVLHSDERPVRKIDMTDDQKGF